MSASGEPNGKSDEPTLIGWIIVFILFVLAGGLWFQAMPVYVQYFRTSGNQKTGANIPGSGRIPGRKPSELAVVFFDVKYGDGILIQAPDMTTTLVDGGEGKRPAEKDVEAYNWGQRLYLPFFQRIGLKKLDQIINTVPLSHHLGAQPTIVAAEKPEVETIFLTGYSSYYYSYRRLKVEAKNKGIPIKTLSEGRQLTLGRGVKAKVIWGDSTKRYPREASQIIYLKYGTTSFLLMADLPGKIEKSLVLKWGDSLKADVLKVGNHGAEDSTTNELLKFARPEYAVISTSRRNPLNAPADDVLKRLKGSSVRYLFRTDQSNHVVFYTDGQQIRTKTDAFPFIHS